MMTAILSTPGFPGPQSPLNPAGPQAQRIEHTLLLIFWITSIVYFLVLAVLAFGTFRRRTRSTELPPPIAMNPAVEKKTTWIVGGALALTTILLFVMLIDSFITSHDTAVLADSQSLQINVYGHQWWWEIEYPNQSQPYSIVRTANEIHVPAGAIIKIHGTSRDVIHSFWAPNIHGKKDLLPGYENDLTLEVDHPGIWRGQCAEYCGLQHAHMSFHIVAQSQPDFDAWYLQQLRPAPEPGTQQAQHGRSVFLSHSCILCHTIRGTTAGATVGPDLTHVASRSMLAAGTLSNDIDHLKAWISNAQALKPGCRMPPNPMPASDLNDLAAYLETLK